MRCLVVPCPVMPAVLHTGIGMMCFGRFGLVRRVMGFGMRQGLRPGVRSGMGGGVMTRPMMSRPVMGMGRLRRGGGVITLFLRNTIRGRRMRIILPEMALRREVSCAADLAGFVVISGMRAGRVTVRFIQQRTVRTSQIVISFVIRGILCVIFLVLRVFRILRLIVNMFHQGRGRKAKPRHQKQTQHDRSPTSTPGQKDMRRAFTDC